MVSNFNMKAPFVSLAVADDHSLVCGDNSSNAKKMTSRTWNRFRIITGTEHLNGRQRSSVVRKHQVAKESVCGHLLLFKVDARNGIK